MDPVSVVLLVVLVLGLVGGATLWQRSSQARARQRLADARADAQRWYDRLGGQVMNLSPNDDPAVKQALVDAGERYNAAGSQLESATTARQFELAGQTAIEGLYYARAGRQGLGLDPGPELPLTEAQRRNGMITSEREVTVQGEHLKAGPQYAQDTPYYYPGGQMRGRHVPAGYYSQPWWRSALSTGVGVLGGMLLFDAMFGGINDFGAGYDSGYAEGAEAYDGDGAGDAGDAGGGFDMGDFGGGDFGGF
ncbi:MAG TPA: hypothetical protein VFZ32_17660 [Micromonosporaceae bacterium]